VMLRIPLDGFLGALAEWELATEQSPGVDYAPWIWSNEGFAGDRFVYFARGPARSVKVGVSVHPELRIADLRAPRLGGGRHRPLIAISGASVHLEKAIHFALRFERLQTHEHDYVTEWFRGPWTEGLVAHCCSLAARGAGKVEAA